MSNTIGTNYVFVKSDDIDDNNTSVDIESKKIRHKMNVVPQYHPHLLNQNNSVLLMRLFSVLNLLMLNTVANFQKW